MVAKYHGGEWVEKGQNLESSDCEELESQPSWKSPEATPGDMRPNDSIHNDSSNEKASGELSPSVLEQNPLFTGRDESTQDEDSCRPPASLRRSASAGWGLADTTNLSRHESFIEVSPPPSWIISHNCALRVRWDISQALILVYVAISVPLRIGFNLEAVGVSYAIELAVELYFYIDIYFNFVTTYEDENMKVVTDFKSIAKNYLGSWFLVDFISVLPLDLAIRISDGMFPCSFYLNGCPNKAGSNAGQYVKLFKLVRLFRLVKLLRLVRLGRLVTKYQDELFHMLRFMATVKLIVLLLYLGHIFGCIFYFFSDDDWLTEYELEAREKGYFVSWLENMFPNISEAPLTERYVAASYWAFTTMTTVGYGDISATTVAERTFAIMGMIVGGLMLSTIVSKIIIIFDEAHLHEKMLKAKMLQVEQWVKDIKLPKEKRSRILTFFRRQAAQPYDEGQLMQQLPFEMRCLVARHMYKRLLDTVPYLCEGDDMFRTQLCVGFRSILLMPKRYVYLFGEVGRDMFVVKEGSIEVVCWNSSDIIGQLEPGEYFGEAAAMGDFRRRETMRASHMCHLLSLNYDHMKPLLDLYPKIKQKMRAMLDERTASYHAETKKGTKKGTCFRNPDEFFLQLSHNEVGEVVEINYEPPKDPYAHCPKRLRDMVTMAINKKKQEGDDGEDRTFGTPTSTTARFEKISGQLKTLAGQMQEVLEQTEQVPEMLRQTAQLAEAIKQLQSGSVCPEAGSLDTVKTSPLC